MCFRGTFLNTVDRLRERESICGGPLGRKGGSQNLEWEGRRVLGWRSIKAPERARSQPVYVTERRPKAGTQ